MLAQRALLGVAACAAAPFTARRRHAPRRMKEANQQQLDSMEQRLNLKIEQTLQLRQRFEQHAVAGNGWR